MGKTSASPEAEAAGLEQARSRELSTANAALEYATTIYGENPGEKLRALARSDLQQAVCELMMLGLSMNQCAELIGIHKSTISKWFSAETSEMQKLMKTALTRDAMIEMPKTWGTLKSARDSENEETRRKAALDCMRAAGMPIDPGLQGASAISIHAQNVQFNSLSVSDLDRKILEIADKLGPEAVKLAESEIKPNGKRATASPAATAEPGLPPAGSDAGGGVPGAPGGAPAP